MTESDLAKIKFRFVMSMSGKYEHMLSYESVGHIPTIGVCIHTPVCKDGTFGREYRHYRFNGKTYKTKKKFLEAMTEFEEERKSKFDKE